MNIAIGVRKLFHLGRTNSTYHMFLGRARRDLLLDENVSTLLFLRVLKYMLRNKRLKTFNIDTFVGVFRQ